MQSLTVMRHSNFTCCSVLHQNVGRDGPKSRADPFDGKRRYSVRRALESHEARYSKTSVTRNRSQVTYQIYFLTHSIIKIIERNGTSCFGTYLPRSSGTRTEASGFRRLLRRWSASASQKLDLLFKKSKIKTVPTFWN
jgi:hypothetical protein